MTVAWSQSMVWFVVSACSAAADVRQFPVVRALLSFPSWPIVSFVSSPTYQLSKYLCYLLRPLYKVTQSPLSPTPAVLYFYCHPGSNPWRILSILWCCVTFYQGPHFTCGSGCKTTPGIGHTTQCIEDYCQKKRKPSSRWNQTCHYSHCTSW